ATRAPRVTGVQTCALPIWVPTFSGGSRDIELVPWDLAQTRHLERSAAFADLVEQQFHDRVPLSAHPIDRAPLRVLESANMPAVSSEERRGGGEGRQWSATG